MAFINQEQSYTIMLSSGQDWKPWIYSIKSVATIHNVWNLCDPKFSIKPTQSIKPTLPVINGDAPDARQILSVWNYELAEFNGQRKGLQEVIKTIQRTVNIKYYHLLIQADSLDPWSILRTLQARLAPSINEQSIEIEQAWKSQLLGPQNQTISLWIQKWEEVYSKALSIGLPETSRAIRDFLMSASTIDEAYTAAKEIQLNQSSKYTSTDTSDFYGLLEEFRQRQAVKALQNRPKPVKHSAFNVSADQQAAFNRNKKTAPNPCICGIRHYFSDCWYINPSIAPENWAPNQHITQQVQNKLSDPKTNAKVQAALEKSRQWKESKSNKHKNENNETILANTSLLAASTATPSLCSSWILDSGATDHICNKTMEHRFIATRRAQPHEVVHCGNSYLPITHFGTTTVQVKHKTPQGLVNKVIKLTNVAMVPDMLTNIVSYHRFLSQGVYWNSRKMIIEEGDRYICEVVSKHGQYLLEANDTSSAFATSTSNLSRTSPTYWHQALAHPSNEAITKLPEAVQSVVISQDGAPTQHCEVCSLTKAQQIISRSSDQEYPPTRPFHKVSIDLIRLNKTSYNQDNWITHLTCMSTNFQMAFTHPNKGQAYQAVMEAIQYIQTQFNFQVQIIRSDNEASIFTTTFLTWIKDKGIALETSAPRTPAQNGHAERAGKTLTMRARAISIHSNIPDSLWPELYKVAGYLINRTPSQKLGWKTPYEAVTNKKPDLSHIKIIGCKAYPLNKQLERGSKLAPRAHIGYLVGYSSRNIFNIWIPSQGKVVRIRDVTFDEMSFFKPEDKDTFYDQQMFKTVSYHDISQEPDPEPQLPSTEELLNRVYDTITRMNEPSILHEQQSRNTQKSVHQEAQVQPLQQATPEPEPANNNQQQDVSEVTRSSSSQAQDTYQAPPTPEPEQSSSTYHHTSIPIHPVTADLSEDNIINAPRIRKPRTGHASEVQGYHQAFTACLLNKMSHGHEHRDQLQPEPSNYKELLSHPHRQQFEQAMKQEINILERKNTWIVVKDNGQQAVPLIWVFKYKLSPSGHVIKHKARLCVRGDLQQTESDTYAATLAAKIFRVLMSITAKQDLNTEQWDVVNAYVNSDIDEETFCKPPPGLSTPSNAILSLKKALYRLKQAPALWYKHFTATLRKASLQEVPDAPCLYTSIDHKLMLFFFVDDIVLLYNKENSPQAAKLKQEIFRTYEMKDLGELNWFLSIKIIRDRSIKTISLGQQSYVEHINQKFTSSVKPPSTPFPSDKSITKQQEQATVQEIKLYQQKVGSINFAATFTRPDISYAASKLSSFLTNPSQEHQDLADRVIKYLATTKALRLTFQPSSNNALFASTDASFATDPATGTGYNGYTFILNTGAVDWKAHKQTLVTTSSTEAELHALSATVKEAMWWQRIFKDLNMAQICTPTKIYCDNQQTIKLVTDQSSKFTTKIRHINIHKHWLRQEYNNKTFTIDWSPSADTIADGFTKPLPPQKHQIFIKQLNLTV